MCKENDTTNIYILSHPLTGEIRYVGKADDPTRRLREHLKPSELKNRCHRTNWISSLLLNGLIPKVEIIDEVQKTEWEFWERHYISLYRSWGFNLVNETFGGDGRYGFIHNEEARKKMSNSRIGRKLSEYHKSQIAKGNTGSKLTEERKKKISESHKGKKMSDEARKKVSISLIGNKRTLGYKHTEETRLKMSLSQKRRYE